MDIKCPKCKRRVVKNGTIHSGKQRYFCRPCKKQFVLDPRKPITKDIWAVIDRLLSEGVSITSLSRVTKISRTWIYRYIKSNPRKTTKRLLAANKKERIQLLVEEYYADTYCLLLKEILERWDFL